MKFKSIRSMLSRALAIFILFSFSSLNAQKYEGVGLFENRKIDLSWLPQFLPYNPIIVEAGAFFGAETYRASKIWPKSKIFAFEPNPYSFEQLQKMIDEQRLSNVKAYPFALNTYNGLAKFNVCLGMEGTDPNFGYASSLLDLLTCMEIYSKGPQIHVPCVILDDWCEHNQIDHIDILRLEVEGMELPVLQSSPKMLKNAKIIYLKTFTHPHRIGMTHYNELRDFLEKSGFVLLSHWYETDIDGHALFLSRELFDAYFKLSLGIYLGV